jgi:hypothetical protein
MSRVTIGFVPRDRFCMAAQALEHLFRHTRPPFQLIVVDCGIPEVYRREMDEVLNGRENVEVIRTPHYLQTNAAHNLVIQRNKDPYLCLIENDNLVHEDWLLHLIAACEEHPADVAVPLIFERTEEKVHFDDRLGHIRTVTTADGQKLAIVPRRSSTESDRTASRRSIELIETHCMLFRSEVLRHIGPLDEKVEQSRQEVDLSLALHHARVRRVFEPKACVTFSPPPPIYPEERDYYLFKWDPDRARQSHAWIKQKWNLVEVPTSVPFVQARRHLAEEIDPKVQLCREFEYRARLAAVTQEIAALVPAGDALILVDDVRWDANEVAADRRAIPFLERDGQYWGPAADDETAIREFERLRKSGAGFMVFGWPAFWWLDHYCGLREHLRSHFPCVLENDRLVAFDLRSGGRL